MILIVLIILVIVEAGSTYNICSSSNNSLPSEYSSYLNARKISSIEETQVIKLYKKMENISDYRI